MNFFKRLWVNRKKERIYIKEPLISEKEPVNYNIEIKDIKIKKIYIKY